MLEPLRVLEAQHGWSSMVGRFLPRELQAGSTSPLAEHTTVLAQGTANLLASKALQAMCADGRRVFYELDDDVFHLDRSNPAYAELMDPVIQQNYRDNLAAVRGVIVTTKALQEVVREHTDAPIYIIPNYIPEWLLHQKRAVHDFKRIREDDSIATSYWRKRLLVVGWAGSSHHAMDWEHNAHRFVQWVGRNHFSVLHAMGEVSYLGQYQSDLPPGRATAEEWNPNIESYLKRLGVLDVGVLPLKQHLFNKSKSSIKALECAAWGIPVVASDVGPYHKFVVPGETGFLFQNPGQMATYLDTLLADRELLASMSANCRIIASVNTYEANGWKWDTVLRT